MDKGERVSYNQAHHQNSPHEVILMALSKKTLPPVEVPPEYQQFTFLTHRPKDAEDLRKMLAFTPAFGGKLWDDGEDEDEVDE